MSAADDIKRLADEFATSRVIDERVTWECRGIAEEEIAERHLNEDANALYAAIDALQAERDALLEALREMTPRTMPPADAPCHYGLVPQEQCGHCSRISRALAAIKKCEEAK
jgi:hypothetical protein